MTTHKKKFKAYIPTLIGAVVLLVAIFFIVRFIGNMEEKPEKKEKKIQPISLLKPPPPPPPPPKVEQPPPPEEKMESVEPEAEAEPEPLPDVADEAPAGDLGLDAEGTAGSDSFGLVGHKGGKGLLGGGGNGDPFAGYHHIIHDEVYDLLNEKEELRKKGFTAIVDIWIDPDGTVKRIELAKGSNDADIDSLLTKLLGKLKKFNEPPPAGMEQPVKLRIKDKI